MSKIIAANYPKLGVQKLVKLQAFEKDLRVDEVKLMQLGSGFKNNVMYLSIGERIYKYDMVTKEQIFQFRTFYQKNGLRNQQIKAGKKSQQHMVLYDNDNKLMISDSEGQIKLWDSSENKDEIPQLVTQIESELQVDGLRVNKTAPIEGERRGVFYHITYSGDEFRIYVDNLNFIRKGTVNQDTITALEYGNGNKYLYIGTKKGMIYRYELPDLGEISAF